jgi:2-C-methyl-D-erythritol 4-phosphate cytidylyltransferase/2-C-methyl-D-erythritol 2,4-cyclodiphosphate synthase
MFVTAIIAGAGRGERLGAARPKQLVSIGGRSMLERSVAAFLEHPSVHEVIVALPGELASNPPSYLRAAAKPVRVVIGGARRQDSVANAFRAASAGCDVVIIHDAARPFVSAGLIARTIAAAAESGAAIAALQARDTVKIASAPTEGGSYRNIAETLPRGSIFLAQTPQAFRARVLADALAFVDDATDEATLAERAGYTVRLVEGEATNIKITAPDDLPLAEAIANAAAVAIPRVGIGYDLHRLVEGRPLILGGVTIPYERGLQGHSDADAICHAAADAVLGAAGCGDIGRHFPDTDPAWAGASSIELLRRSAAMIRDAGHEIGNVDMTVIAERPKLIPYVDAMRANIAAALRISPDAVGIKGKTNEGVGELGRGEAIAVHAIAMVRRRI